MEKIYKLDENGYSRGENREYTFERIFDDEEEYKNECVKRKRNGCYPSRYYDRDIIHYGSSYIKNLKINYVEGEDKLKLVKYDQVTLIITPKVIREDSIKKGFFKKVKVFIVEEWDFSWKSIEKSVKTTLVVKEEFTYNKVTIKE